LEKVTAVAALTDICVNGRLHIAHTTVNVSKILQYFY